MDNEQILHKYTIIDTDGKIVNEFDYVLEQHESQNTKLISLKYANKKVNKELFGVIYV